MSKERIPWNAPVKPLEVNHDGSSVRADAGRWLYDYTATFSKDDVERFRLGRVCLKCLEPQEIAFPDKCSLCGYAIKRNQPWDFNRTFAGTTRVGPSTTISEELDRLDEVHERNIWVPRQSIFIAGKGTACFGSASRTTNSSKKRRNK